jgi:chromosomal replication initiator protein
MTDIHTGGRWEDQGAGEGGGAGTAMIDRILTRLSEEVGQENYSRYFSHQARIGVTGYRVEVVVPTGFVGDLISRRFGESLRKAAAAEMGAAEEGRIVEVKFRVDRGAFTGRPSRPPEPVPQVRPTGAARATPPRTSNSVLRHRLSEFVVGDSNRLAYTGAMQLSDAGGPPPFTLLFVHGLCGLGKTHLLQGAAARFRELHPGAKVRYTTAEDFTNDFVAGVRNSRLDSFRAAYRGLDLLVVDDVQFLASKTQTQNELLHTFNAVNLGGARIILASDEHPRQSTKLGSALVSRFMSGMVVRLDPPEGDLRQQILNSLAERRGLRLEAAASACIAEFAGRSPGSSVRDLEGALTQVDAMARLMPELVGSGQSIGLHLVHKALGIGAGNENRGFRPRKPIRVDRISDEVCRTLRVEADELMGRGRHRRVVLARTLVAHLSRTLTTLSYPEIARAMGRPNHSTIVTACQRFGRQLAADEGLDLGPDLPELAGLNLKGLTEQVRQGVLRSA